MKGIILPQIVAIGIYSSSVAVKNKSITKNRKTSMFEIEIPLENGGISYIDSEQTAIRPNMVICAKPGQVRHTKLPFKCYYIHMILKEGLLYDILMQTPSFIFTTDFSEYQELFKSLFSYQKFEMDSNSVILQSLILKLVYMLNRESKKSFYIGKSKNAGYDRIEQILKYINNNLSEDLSLKTLAKIASYSPIHFHNYFKIAAGKTLHEYVEEQRIKQSILLLTTTSLTLAEIAVQCGFSSQAYFNYVFKRRMHLTPREYIKEEYMRYQT